MPGARLALAHRHSVVSAPQSAALQPLLYLFCKCTRSLRLTRRGIAWSSGKESTIAHVPNLSPLVPVGIACCLAFTLCEPAIYKAISYFAGRDIFE